MKATPQVPAAVARGAERHHRARARHLRVDAAAVFVSAEHDDVHAPIVPAALHSEFALHVNFVLVVVPSKWT